MDVVEFLAILAVLAVAVAVISAPLRRPPSGPHADEAGPDVDALEAAREAKYRELREAELDRRTGKLSAEDWEVVDRTLRAEAMEILRQLDRAREG